MKVHLISAYDTHPMLDRMRELAAMDSTGRHELCDSPAEADIIVFVENAHFDDYLYKRLRNHPLVARYRPKVYMYNEVDRPYCVLPGLYCCMPRRFFRHDRQVAFPYLFTPNRFVPEIHKLDVERRWLFSFVGAMSHRSRRRIIALGDGDRGLQDTSEFNVWSSDDTERRAQGQNFAEIMAESRFVLCPRGLGTSSFRLFESMEAARAPVIISDHWVPTPQVDWSFAVRVRENEVSRIPEILRSIADEAEDRGRAAREAWQAVYAPEKLFDTAIESLGLLHDARQGALQSGGRREWLHSVLIGSELKTLNAARRMRDVWLQATAPVGA